MIELNLYIYSEGSAHPADFQKKADYNISRSPFRICVPRSFPEGINSAIISHLWAFQAKPVPETSGKQI